MQNQEWYTELITPVWAPPAWLFGPVWTLLYTTIAVSFGVVFYQAFRNQISRKIAIPFALNLVFNFAFTPLQFGLRNNVLASIDIVLVVGTLIWALTAVWIKAPQLKWIVYVNIPYLLWTSFATALQLTITYMNWS